MKTLETARNVVNSEQLEAWLVEKFTDGYPELMGWINTVVRKWCIKNAPVVVAPLADMDGIPPWLRTAMEKGQQPENIVLDDALIGIIRPVLDYMANLLEQKPETITASIGFEVARQRAIKWHEEMRKAAERRDVVVPQLHEDGVAIMKTYPDGYTWRVVTSKDALIREGDAMGHCVGRMNYYGMVLRSKVSIVSLRDPENKPHVTIEIGNGGESIHQIKGTANTDVVAKYLPYVRDFLTSRSWNAINFDGAASLRREVLQNQMFTAEPWWTDGRVRIVKAISDTYNPFSFYAAFFTGTQEVIGMMTVNEAGIIRSVEERKPGRLIDILDSIRDAAVAKELRVVPSQMKLFALGAEWKKLTGNAAVKIEWCVAANDTARDLVKLLLATKDINVQVCFDEAGEPIAAYYEGRLEILLTVGGKRTDLLAETLSVIPDKGAFTIDILFGKKPVQLIDLSERLRKKNAGMSVDATSDESLLNSLLTALNQPNALALKKGYLHLKERTKLSDSDFKSLGFATGGRAINGIGTVLLCTLPINNSAPFRRYVFQKPNLMTCWTEMLSHPDHLLTALGGYGLDKVIVTKIVELLRNEFLRLAPSEAEIEDLDLDGGEEQRVRQALKFVKSHKQNKLRSKALWSSIK